MRARPSAVIAEKADAPEFGLWFGSCDDAVLHHPEDQPASIHLVQEDDITHGAHDVERIVLSARDGDQCFCAQLSPEHCTLKGDIGVQPVRT